MPGGVAYRGTTHVVAADHRRRTVGHRVPISCVSSARLTQTSSSLTAYKKQRLETNDATRLLLISVIFRQQQKVMIFKKLRKNLVVRVYAAARFYSSDLKDILTLITRALI